MYKEQILDYYSRPEIQKAILEIAENREVVPTLASGGFGTRPNVIFFEKDIEQLVKQGADSFHCSVERWSDPLKLRTEMRKSEMDELRIGWDLILDIDCYKGLDYAEKAALIFVEALEQYDIRSYSIKFSGNRGFHIGVPFECFPEEIMNLGNIEKDFPRTPKAIIEYLKDFTKKDLRAAFKENPEKILSLDSGIITTRHLFRTPYSLHSKTWLSSIPVTKDQLEGFDKKTAKVENVKVGKKFLSKADVRENEAVELLQSAIFWAERNAKEKISLGTEEFKIPESAIPLELWPPCMHNIYKGLDDGRKRSIFAYTTFLANIGWKKEDIEKFILSWNQKNNPPLRVNLIKLTINSQFSRKTVQMTPNCSNVNYFRGYGVCKPDAFCPKIHNPVTYTLRKFRRHRAFKGPIKKRRKKRFKTDIMELAKR